MNSDSHTQLPKLLSASFYVSSFFFFLFFSSFFCFFEDISISDYFSYHYLPSYRCMESTSYVFFSGGVFLPCDHGPDFWHQFIMW